MSIASQIRNLVETKGFIGLEELMQTAMTGKVTSYYRMRQPIGEEADFITSPEVSQMFGEMIGIWCIDLWTKLGSPKEFNLVEYGAGLGSLMRDVLRMAKREPKFYEAVRVAIIDISPKLKAAQRKVLKELGVNVKWVRSIADVPNLPTIVLANEFFDALPIRQYLKQKTEWMERVLTIDPDSGMLRFDLRGIKKMLSDQLMIEHKNAHDGSVVEESAESIRIIKEISRHIKVSSGGALIIDYGYDIPPRGGRTRYQYTQTLQAVKAHKYIPILDSLGEADMSAHVDFWSLKEAAKQLGARTFGAILQSQLLSSCGIEIRLKQLIAHNPELSQTLKNQYHMLMSRDQMGELFKAIAIFSGNDGLPLGFNSI